MWRSRGRHGWCAPRQAGRGLCRPQEMNQSYPKDARSPQTLLTIVLGAGTETAHRQTFARVFCLHVCDALGTSLCIQGGELAPAQDKQQ